MKSEFKINIKFAVTLPVQGLPTSVWISFSLDLKKQASSPLILEIFLFHCYKIF